MPDRADFVRRVAIHPRRGSGSWTLIWALAYSGRPLCHLRWIHVERVAVYHELDTDDRLLTLIGFGLCDPRLLHGYNGSGCIPALDADGWANSR